jgi:hypothetical protein
MKKIIMLSALLGMAWVSRAQTAGNNPAETDSLHHKMHHQWQIRDSSDRSSQNRDWRHHDRRRDPDRHRMHFTAEQRSQMTAINKDYQTKEADLFKNDNLTLRQYKAQLLALQKEKKSKLQALLTPEQKDQLAREKKQAAEDRQVMAAARLEKLKIHLNLTDEQAAKIKSSQAGLSAQAQSIRENEDLLPQQKMEEYKSLMAKQEQAIASVLTSDQRAKYEEMKDDRDHFSERRMNR